MKKYLLVLVSIIFVISCNSDDDNIEEKNCCSADSYVIQVDNLPEGKEIEHTKYFTPNQDGFHETFYIDGLEDFPDNTVSIFLGNTLVFIADGYGTASDKVFGSELFDQNFDTKVYRYELKIDNGDTFKATGYVCAIKVQTNTITCSLFDPLDPDPVIRD